MDALKESIVLPSINPFLLCTCLNLNTSLLQSYRLINFLNLSIQFILSVMGMDCGRQFRQILTTAIEYILKCD
jgi:hypothetical protein